MPVVSFGREKTWVIQDQSKAWTELLLGQPEGLENGPKDPDCNPQQSEAMGRRKGRTRAAPPPPAQPSRLKARSHLHTRGHAWSNHTDQTPQPIEQDLP